MNQHAPEAVWNGISHAGKGFWSRLSCHTPTANVGTLERTTSTDKRTNANFEDSLHHEQDNYPCTSWAPQSAKILISRIFFYWHLQTFDISCTLGENTTALAHHWKSSRIWSTSSCTGRNFWEMKISNRIFHSTYPHAGSFQNLESSCQAGRNCAQKTSYYRL